MRSLRQFLQENKRMKNITLFFDIETFQYNEKAGYIRPSNFKNKVFSVAVSWLQDEIVEYEIFPNFKMMFNEIISVFENMKKKPKIILNAHNSNKYDNHYLRRSLIDDFDLKVENFYIMTGTTERSNENSLRIKDLDSVDKQRTILEKRIKSKINLEMTFFLKSIQFETVDNWLKTNSSLAMLGQKLKTLGKVTDDELKTDFDYTKYNLDNDLDDYEAEQYAMNIFKNLDKDQLKYIRNDVILLAKSVYWYSELFNGFDYTKRTFTSNILEAYNDNNLTSLQLLNRVKVGKKNIEIKYTDYQFANQNFYDYLKPFYRGGLNFYNIFKIGKVINNVWSMDINSSYPYAMYGFKVPTFLHSYQEYEKQTIVDINYSDDYYTLFQISKEVFDNIILKDIESIVFKQMLVKYYTTNETINLNTYTFKMIEKVTGIKFTSIPVFSTVTFETEYFGSREKISEFYYIKTAGKNKKKIDFKDPFNIQQLDEDNTTVFTKEEIDNSKVNLNGLYGIPALRPYFNLFRYKKGEYYNIENGHKNAERNIVFSIFVTSVSLWNLLSPLGYLTPGEIDKYFLYCDTDSLYLSKEIQHKIPDTFFDDYALGKWDIEHENITHFYVLNHKKYTFIDPDEFDKNGQPKGIQVRAGGVPLDSFDRDMPFEQFIETQFSDGVEIKALKSIYNNDETISLYTSTTKLEMGQGYRIRSGGIEYEEMKNQMFKEIRENLDEFHNDALYIESTLGTFSLAEIFPYTHEVKKAEPLAFLEIKQDKIKAVLDK